MGVGDFADTIFDQQLDREIIKLVEDQQSQHVIVGL